MPRPAVQRILTVALLLAVAAPAAADWRRVDSPNFVVVGDVGAGTLKDIAVKFEAFRETLGRVLSSRVTETAVPTVVIVFPSDKALTPFKPRFNGKPIEIAGLFMPRQDANSIAVLANGNPDGMRVVFHEYAHLIASNATQSLPVWLNEGLAEYYSTFELAGNRQSAVLGRVVGWHLQLLAERTMLPLPELITIGHGSRHYNEGNQRGVFYAESWALTHMLLQGQPDRRPQTGKYLTLTSRGTPSADAWQSAFGTEDLEKALQVYVRQRSFTAVRYNFSEKIAAFKAEAAKLPAADADGFLAYFLVQQGRIDEAAELLARRKATDTSPWLATVTAMITHRKGDTAAARTQLAAVDSGGDWLTAYFVGLGLAELTGRGASADDIAAIGRQFARVQELHGDVPNAIIRLARVELDAEAVPPAATTAAVERARMQVPGRSDYAFVLARLQARQHAFEAARTTMGPLMSGLYPDRVREPARSLMQYIVGMEAYEKDRASRAAARATASTTAVDIPDAPPVEPTDLPDTLPRELTPEERAARADATKAAADEPIPEDVVRLSDLRSIYREVMPEERRVEGTLTAIRCNEAGGATFHLSTADGGLDISTPRMGDVDFVTYRTDLSGSIACGPLASPVPVYLTSKEDPNAAGGTVVVAVEFLQK